MKHATVSLPPSLLSSPTFQLEKIYNRVKANTDRVLDHYQLSIREYWILMYLDHADAQSQAALSESLSIDRSDLVRFIDSLESRGFAQRIKDKKDRRKQKITITPKGRKFLSKLSPLILEAEEKALDDSTTKQLKHLRKLAEVIISTDEK